MEKNISVMRISLRFPTDLSYNVSVPGGADSPVLSKSVHEQSRTQFRFEPSRFWRHELAPVGNGEQFRERRREQAQAYFRLAAIDELPQFRDAVLASDKIDARIDALIGDTEERLEQLALQAAQIELRRGVSRTFRVQRDTMPLP